MRIRTIKPEFWTHPIMGRADDSVKCLALALLNYADDDGYFLADPSLVRSSCRPFDESSGTSTVLIRDLSKLGWILIVEHPSAGMIGKVVNFKDHQVVNKPKQSKLKKYFDDTVSVPYEYGISTVRNGSGSGREQGKEIKSKSIPSKKLFGEFQNVELTEDEFQKLEERFGSASTMQKIEKLSGYVASKGKKYKSHYATILTWSAEDSKPGQLIPFQKQPQKTFDQIRTEATLQAAIEFAGGMP